MVMDLDLSRRRDAERTSRLIDDFGMQLRVEIDTSQHLVWLYLWSFWRRPATLCMIQTMTSLMAVFFTCDQRFPEFFTTSWTRSRISQVEGTLDESEWCQGSGFYL